MERRRVGFRVILRSGAPKVGYAAIYTHTDQESPAIGGGNPAFPPEMSSTHGWVGCVARNHPAGAGYAEPPDGLPTQRWYTIDLGLGGRTPAFSVPSGDGPLFLILDARRDEAIVLPWDGGAPPDLGMPPEDGKLLPRPERAPNMEFKRTNPPFNQEGGEPLITLGRGIRNLVGFADLGMLSNAHVTEDGLRTFVAATHSVGGDVVRFLKDLGVKNDRPAFIHSTNPAWRRRLRAVLDEGRARGVWALVCAFDEPERNTEERRGPGYSKRDNSLRGHDRLTASLAVQIVNEDFGWTVGEGLRSALIVEGANEGVPSWFPTDVATALYERAGKSHLPRFISNANSLDGGRSWIYEAGSPITLHMHDYMPTEPRELVRLCLRVSERFEGKPIVLDSDGRRLWKHHPGDDSFRGWDASLEAFQALTEAGIGVIAMFTGPFQPHDPFREITLPSPFPSSNDRTITTWEAMRRIAKACGLDRR